MLNLKLNPNNIKYLKSMVYKLIKNKKIFNDFYEYSIVNDRNRIVRKVIASKNFNLVFMDSQWESRRLYSVKVKNIFIDKKGESKEFENFILINDKNEVLLENIKSILALENHNNSSIIEFDTRTINLKKFNLKKNDKLFCIINKAGIIIKGPTTTEIKYSPFINCILIGNKNFTTYNNQEVYDSVEEVIKDNTYVVNKGNKQGLLFGQAFWNENEKNWRSYTCIHWQAKKYETIEFYQTAIYDFYIVKLANLYTFYNVKRYNLGLQNEFFGNKYKKIKKIFNKSLYLNMGFLCIKEDGLIDYVYGFNNLHEFKTEDENEAMQMINDMIINKNIFYENLSSNFPDIF